VTNLADREDLLRGSEQDGVVEHRANSAVEGLDQEPDKIWVVVSTLATKINGEGAVESDTENSGLYHDSGEGMTPTLKRWASEGAVEEQCIEEGGRSASSKFRPTPC
jgi:hypothetical protein